MISTYKFICLCGFSSVHAVIQFYIVCFGFFMSKGCFYVTAIIFENFSWFVIMSFVPLLRILKIKRKNNSFSINILHFTYTHTRALQLSTHPSITQHHIASHQIKFTKIWTGTVMRMWNRATHCLIPTANTPRHRIWTKLSKRIRRWWWHQRLPPTPATLQLLCPPINWIGSTFIPSNVMRRRTR